MFLSEYGEKWLDVDGVRTRYFEAGSGSVPVVLVHGGGWMIGGVYLRVQRRWRLLSSLWPRCDDLQSPQPPAPKGSLGAWRRDPRDTDGMVRRSEPQ